MKKAFSSLIFIMCSITIITAQNAELIVDDMVIELGGKKAFYEKKNVTYDLEYRDPNSQTTLVSKEVYVFDKEKSFAEYTEHSMLGEKGNVIEAYDGETAWIKFDGELSNDEQSKGIARFWRKTNYYWFTMFFKLQNEGVNLEYIESKKVEGRDYDLIKVSFGKDVGDTQDTYILYINKRTKLVDQLLFTVVAFNITKPELYKFHYETIDGIKVPTERVEISSNWNGEVVGKKWATTYWTNIKFNIAVDKAIFSK